LVPLLHLNYGGTKLRLTESAILACEEHQGTENYALFTTKYNNLVKFKENSSV